MGEFDPRRPSPFTACERQPVTDAGARGASIRWIIDTRHGAPTYRLRIIELEPGGHTPLHAHWFEHENFVLSGEGEVQIGDQVYPIRAGDVVFVPPHVTHQYRNTGPEPLRFLCGIPAEWVRAARPDVYGEPGKGPPES